MSKYEVIMGLEIHARILTSYKVFSKTKIIDKALPNTMITAPDIALPGALPIINYDFLMKANLFAKHMHMNIQKEIQFDRKHYFYRDNPKGYQITQYFKPIGQKGYLEIFENENFKKINITEMHMEEDTAQTKIHNKDTILDFNRAGMPLIEIVSEPDFKSANDLINYLEQVRFLLVALNLGDAKLEDGSMRVDLNISVRLKGENELRQKVEIKNLNSYNNIKLSVEEEVLEQINKYENDEVVLPVTKNFNEKTKKLEIMREKEEIVDYRYLPDPNLPMFNNFTEKEVNNYYAKNLIFKNDINNIANQITQNKLNLKDYIKLGHEGLIFLISLNIDYKVNWLEVEQFRRYLQEYLTQNQKQFNDLKIELNEINQLFVKLNNKEINKNHFKKIIPLYLSNSSKTVDSIIDEYEFKVLSDNNFLINLVEEVLNNNPQPVQDYKNGRDRMLGFLVGQVMKESKGQADPQAAKELVMSALEKR